MIRFTVLKIRFKLKFSKINLNLPQDHICHICMLNFLRLKHISSKKSIKSIRTAALLTFILIKYFVDE